MDETGYLTLELLNEAKGFNEWMYSKIETYIGTNVLEIGSGIGNLTANIKAQKIYATDYSEEYVAILKDKFRDNKRIIPSHLDISQSKANIVDNIDTIVCLNVLEHIEDHYSAVRNMNKSLIPGGTLILLVPYSNILYSKLDELLGHFRRYTKKKLAGVVESGGFTVKKMFYFNLPGGIGWFVRGKILKEKTLSKTSIQAFEKLIPLFKIIEWFGVPFGASLICVASKIKEVE